MALNRLAGNPSRIGGQPTPVSSLPPTVVSVSSNSYKNTSSTTGTTANALSSRQHPHINAPPSAIFTSPSGARANRKTVYDRSLNRSRTAELSRSAFAYLFMEMVAYAQRRRKGDTDIEKTLNSQGYPIGIRLLDLLLYRTTSTSTSTSSTVAPPSSRPTRILYLLQFIHTTLWRHLFDRPADGLDLSVSNKTEYMLTDLDQLVNRYISVPNEYSQLNCAAFVAGIIEGVCDGAGFPTEGVTAHWVQEEDKDGPNGRTNIATVQGKTIFLIKFKEEVIQREEMLERG